MVTEGFTPVEGVDYFCAFTFVARYNTDRFLMVLSVQKGCERSCLDVKVTFLNDGLDE